MYIFGIDLHRTHDSTILSPRLADPVVSIQDNEQFVTLAQLKYITHGNRTAYWINAHDLNSVVVIFASYVRELVNY